MPEPLTEYFDEVEARFAAVADLDLGLEEEFQILDPQTLELTPGFEALRDNAPARLSSRIAGELLRCEIEVSTAKAAQLPEAASALIRNRHELFAHADEKGYALGSTGTHPFSSWRDQQIIDTPHYRLVEERLKYVAWRNNTWASHTHVGVRGLDRAIYVCDHLRAFLPHLLALSANSPFIEGVFTHLHSARSQTFLRMFPRCGIPDASGSWAEHRRFYEQLVRVNSIQEFTQIWWAVRPHHRFGTVEVRICDAQMTTRETIALTALTQGLIAHLARRYDEGDRTPGPATRYVEENLWRAIRYGLDGALIDWEREEEVAAGEAVRRLIEVAAAYGDELNIAAALDDAESIVREGNGAQRQMRALASGMSMAEVYAETVAEARADAGL